MMNKLQYLIELQQCQIILQNSYKNDKKMASWLNNSFQKSQMAILNVR
jgi:hypothetical protein